MSTSESSERVVLVRQARWAAEGVLELQLADPAGASLPLWEPGAHLDLVLPSGLRRSYSLCGDPADRDVWTIAVRREPDGRGGSREVHDTGLVGRTLTAHGPVNRFPLVDAPGHLLLAGGIGVTPLLAMARALQRAGRPWRMVYAARDRQSFAYADELTRLGGEDQVRLVPEHKQGRPDLAAELAAVPAGHAVYCCGPEGMIEAITRLCADSVPPRDLHVERFAAASEPSDVPADGFEVYLRSSDLRLRVPADRSLLDVVRDHLPGVPYSCEEGYCGTCETPVLAGLPDHRDTVIDPSERETATTMMICVSRAAASAVLELDL
ncbi:PDR/VanB family oxidoreductase [Streptomyces sp. NPDC059373]